MYLNDSEQSKILKRFPKFELSYDKQIHKKVYTSNDIFMAIPFGNKFYAWFTYYQEKYVCMLIELYSNRKIKKINIRPCCFDESLSDGTILYGTLINDRFFYIENIYFYCGNSMLNKSFNYKFDIYLQLFNKICQKSFVKNDIIFTTPLVDNNYDKILNLTETLPYKTYGFRFINPLSKPSNKFDNDRIFVHKKYKQQYFGVFKIMASEKNDIYNIYCYNEKSGKIEYHDIAYIPSYVCSVKMNELFRNIKENRNLDLLEESDDEDEFENISETKYVYMNKSVIMNCEFNSKFKRWEPTTIAEKYTKLSTSRDVNEIENKFKRNNRKQQFNKNRNRKF